jgi:hypothetical protein
MNQYIGPNAKEIMTPTILTARHNHANFEEYPDAKKIVPKSGPSGKN